MLPSRIPLGGLQPGSSCTPSYISHTVVSLQSDCCEAKPAAAVQGSARGAAAGEQLHARLADFGDPELVMTGLHEHALGLRYLDIHMLASARAAGASLPGCTGLACTAGSLQHGDSAQLTCGDRLPPGNSPCVPGMQSICLCCTPCRKQAAHAEGEHDSMSTLAARSSLTPGWLCADSLACGDRLLAAMGRRSEYALMKYLPSCFLSVRTLVGHQDRWPP